ncbi:MAG: type II toxin-antitoxin system RelE/ParE family toxin [Aphanizomenon gracile PMC649.10]|jgi:mRNA interferase RelE/StbE|uniref:type II toxin-antitoxin system RelE family toxin n=1 Tax=Dolichospermum sp. LEGE 00240 TaxID=1828603 RepID=UPI001D13781B|nr:type II toxin-antitoxin system RelE/ParE family toxin [Dolichospermum sp. LEGE 00240]MDM3846712.1 type II toxin-antitoxin system RelE/ParE family toxin [Aphanizomenon gracile PMC638.10]MDM3852682.1 type II toxin-antitoxin system RelE/ParE family toxin [Aphanizomenon gracile PMC627.10]MDM3854863.1 type II toxin-antitoxin system RelE/ParE family toxin [Aphanizomenon gracile PMC649.10]MDM3859065.1 type II toxin-antitoxin system RelE/ParE family toxin [Aphanizomenon gracile PMC644.10]
MMQNSNSDFEKPQTDNIEFEIQLTPLALEMLANIKDKRHQKTLSSRIDKLKIEPEKQGKPLTGQLINYRSLRAVGQRYRIVYQVENDKVVVLVVGIGLRKDGDKADIYNLLQKLL